MENIVFLELLRQKEDYDVFYWKDYQQREVDFVLKDRSKITELIQVTYASDRQAINEREVKNLIIASENLHCNNLLIITWDYEGWEKIEGKKIKFVPLWKWLLEIK